MASTLDLLRTLVEHRVRFVLVGGMAATVHGSSVVTEDVDLCIEFDEATLTSVIDSLQGMDARQRMTPALPPLPERAAELVGSRNLSLVTKAGQLDFLGAVTGVGPYAEVVRGSIEVDLGGFKCRVMGLDDLIRCKRALGRDKDVRVAAELEAIRERLRSNRS